MKTPFDMYTYNSMEFGYKILVLATDDTRLVWTVRLHLHGTEWTQVIKRLTFEKRPNKREMTKKVKEAWRGWLAQRHHDCATIELEGSVQYDDEEK